MFWVIRQLSLKKKMSTVNILMQCFTIFNTLYNSKHSIFINKVKISKTHDR